MGFGGGGDGGVGRALEKMTTQMREQNLQMLNMQGKMLKEHNNLLELVRDTTREQNNVSVQNLNAMRSQLENWSNTAQERRENITNQLAQNDALYQKQRSNIAKEEEYKMTGRKKKKNFFDYFTSAIVQ